MTPFFLEPEHGPAESYCGIEACPMLTGFDVFDRRHLECVKPKMPVCEIYFGGVTAAREFARMARRVNEPFLVAQSAGDVMMEFFRSRHSEHWQNMVARAGVAPATWKFTETLYRNSC